MAILWLSYGCASVPRKSTATISQIKPPCPFSSSHPNSEDQSSKSMRLYYKRRDNLNSIVDRSDENQIHVASDEPNGIGPDLRQPYALNHPNHRPKKDPFGQISSVSSTVTGGNVSASIGSSPLAPQDMNQSRPRRDH